MWKRGTIASKKTPKGSKKVWEDFMQWLRTHNVKTVKYFQKECELKWLVNNHSERLHAKENEDMHKAFLGHHSIHSFKNRVLFRAAFLDPIFGSECI